MRWGDLEVVSFPAPWKLKAIEAGGERGMGVLPSLHFHRTQTTRENGRPPWLAARVEFEDRRYFSVAGDFGLPGLRIGNAARTSTSMLMPPALTGKRNRQGRTPLFVSGSATFGFSLSLEAGAKLALVELGSTVVGSPRRCGACGLAQGSELPGREEGVAGFSGSGGNAIGDPSAASACGSDRLGIDGIGMGMGTPGSTGASATAFCPPA
jgi:hypothetical protein